MERRELLKHLLAILPASVFVPSFLQSCSKDLVPGDITFKGKVLIVGGGAAGIYAGQLLLNNGIDVTILEASNRLGGRIHANTSFSDLSIELGAEEIHGNRSVLYDLATHFANNRVFKDEGTDYYLLNNQLRTETYLKEAADLAGEGQVLFQIMESLGSYPGGNQTVTQYLEDFPLDSRLMDIANALIGNEYGADNDYLGMLALREAESLYSSGLESYRFKSGNYWQLFEAAFPEAMSKVILMKAVNSVDSSGGNVVITTNDGASYTADKVIVTASLGVLKAGVIAFNPELPSKKLSAISKIGMGTGLKVILKFSTRFWAEDTSSIVGGDEIPEFWVTHAGKSSSEYLLTAFVMGQRAVNLIALSDTAIIQHILTELSSMYPSGNVNSLYTGQFIIQNWSNEPYIRGTYSFPSLEAAGQREFLAESIDGKIYFAGEATNINGHIGTVHGAMESAYLAVSELLTS